MKAVIQDFVDARNPQSLQEYDRALRELDLWSARFFAGLSERILTC
jgi:hypothetical protein